MRTDSKLSPEAQLQAYIVRCIFAANPGLRALRARMRMFERSATPRCVAEAARLRAELDEAIQARRGAPGRREYV